MLVTSGLKAKHVQMSHTSLGAIQVLRNADGGRGVSNLLGKGFTKVHVSTLLALRGGGLGSKFNKKKALRNT